jgi:SAM-dependent methyltransferase
MPAAQPSHVGPAEEWERHWPAYDQAAQINPAQRYRRKLIFSALERDSRKGPLRLLDLGCGQGDFLRAALQTFPGAQLAGLDLSQAALSLAKERIPEARLVCADFSKPLTLPVDLQRWATHLVCTEVLEHLDHPAQFLSEIRGAISGGGKLLVTVPGGPRSAFDLHIGHRRHYTADSLSQLFNVTGYRTIAVAAAGFPFFNLYRLAVILRGRRLIADIGGENTGRVSPSAVLAMRVFDQLFRFNHHQSRWGWQIFGIGMPG